MRFLLISLCLLFSAAIPGTAAARSIADIAARAERREPVSVVFFGGSLTFGANASDPETTSYRGLTMRWLRERYPHTPFTFHDAAIGGTGSQLGMFRLERDVLHHKPDLVFLDFTVNDGAEDTDAQALASYESILRELLAADAAVMPVLMPFKWHAEKPDAPRPPRHEAHLKLAAAYGLTAANVLDSIRLKVREGTRTADIWNMGDGAHPGDEGYRLFFEAVRDAFEKGAEPTSPFILSARPLFEDLYPKRTRRLLTDALPEGWKRQHTWRTALWYDGMASRWMGDVAVAAKGSAPLEMDFEGSMVALFGERNGFTPPLKIRIDGKPVFPPKGAGEGDLWKLDTTRFAPAKKGSGNLFLWQIIARDLPDGKHTLRIEPQWEGTDKEACLRIESVCSAGR